MIMLYHNNKVLFQKEVVLCPIWQQKLLMLFFYTVVHGIMMFLAGVPFFFYKLTGKKKEEIHNAVLAQREQYASAE